jgi:hypothetical protein
MMRNYRIYIHFKKKKSKVKRFVDETGETIVAPDVSVIQEPTEILDPSQCLDYSQLTNYVDDWKMWLETNGIRSMGSYLNWFNSNQSKIVNDPKYGKFIPTNIGLRCFRLVSPDRLRADTRKEKINPVIMDQIAPLVSTRLSKELVFKFLSDKFGDDVNLRSLENFMKNESNYIKIRYSENGRVYQRKGVLIDNIVYPWISDVRENRGGEYDSEIFGYINDYINEKSNVHILSNSVNINDANESQIEKIFNIIVEDMIKKKFIDYNYDDLDNYANKFLPKTRIYSQIQNYLTHNDISYIIPSTRYMSDEVKSILLKILRKNRTKSKIGTDNYIIRCIDDLEKLFPNFDFIFNASIIRYFNDFKDWLYDNFETRKILSTNMALDYLIGNNGGSNIFHLSTLKQFPDSFEVVQNSNETVDIKVSQPINTQRKVLIQKGSLLHRNLQHSQVNPTKYSIDLLVVDKVSKRPLVAYESDGTLHYQMGHLRKSTPDRFLRSFINDQLQNVFLREKGIDVIRIPHRKTVGYEKDSFCSFVQDDLKNKFK